MALFTALYGLLVVVTIPVLHRWSLKRPGEV